MVIIEDLNKDRDIIEFANKSYLKRTKEILNY